MQLDAMLNKRKKVVCKQAVPSMQHIIECFDVGALYVYLVLLVTASTSTTTTFRSEQLALVFVEFFYWIQTS